MRKPNKPSWLDWLAQVLKVTGVVTIVSFGVGWGGWRLWSFFSPPSAPPKKPTSTSEPMDRPSKKKKETASDEDSTSVVAGSETTNRLEGTPELKTLPASESDAEYEIRKREVLIREIESLISLSNSKTAEIDPDWNYLRKAGFSEEVIKLDPTYNLFAVEESIRNEHRTKIRVLQNEINDYKNKNNLREPDEEENETLDASLEISGPVSLLDDLTPSSVAGSGSEPTVGSQATTSFVAISDFTPSSVAGSGSGTGGQSSESQEQSQELPGIDEEEEQKQKNEVLLQRISFKEGRIREINLLLTKSNSITHDREAEWKSILTALSAYGIRKEVIRAQPTFKQLERDKVRVLAGEQASRAKYRAQISLLRHQIQKDKNNIR